MTVNRLFTTLFMLVWWGSLGYCFWLLYVNHVEYERERFVRDAVARAEKLQRQKQNRARKRLVFCEGSKKNVAWVELVDAETFYELCNRLSYGDCSDYPYGLLDMNNASVFFDVKSYL